jgi:hypothetical protein
VYVTRPPSSLTRKASTGVSAQAHYVDLSRSSVTPFQAVQYADISRRLNTDVPGPMPASLIAAAIDSVTKVEDHERPRSPPSDDTHGSDHHLSFPAPPAHDLPPPSSPFAEAPPADEYVRAALPGDDDHDAFDAPDELMPPAPARERITSTPPMLPEITLPQRAFSPGFSSPRSYDFPASVTPSPRLSAMDSASSNAPVPRAFQGSPLAGPAQAQGQAPSPQGHSPGDKRRDTVYTLYDPDDAYGGI